MTRKRWVLMLGGTGLFAGVAWLLSSPSASRPPYGFIPDMAPTKALTFSGGTVAVYQFRGDLNATVRAAEAAATSSGYRATKTVFQKTTTFNFGHESLEISPGRTEITSGGSSLLVSGDEGRNPGFVTVAIVTIGVPESCWDGI